MLTLITGTPGSGKTLFAVTKILEYVKQNQKLLEQGKEPRLIYADIDGLMIDGVEPAPDDWRTTPDGSVIFYDEIQQREVFKKSRFDNEIVDDLQIHRHTGHDIYGITQFPVLLHPNFRAVVGMHYHLHRGWGLASATVFTWAYCVDAPNAPSNKKLVETQSTFKYPKEVYKYYKSASKHTHKARIPLKFFALPALVLALGITSVVLLSKTSYFTNLIKPANPKGVITTQDKSMLSIQTDEPVNTPPPTQPPPSPQEAYQTQQQNRRLYLLEQNLPQDYEIRRNDPMLQIRGVVEMKGQCTAYNAYGDAMTLSNKECKEYVNTGRVYRSTSTGINPALPVDTKPLPQPSVVGS